ncbi:MAG: heme o synthase [Thermoplasmatales archaeon]
MTKFGKAFNLTKPGIAILLDLVAVATFALGLTNLSVLWKVLPLLVSGTLASFSSSLANNFIDRDIDRKMGRTKWRSSIGSTMGYLVAIPVMLGVSLTVSLIFLNVATTLWIFAGFLSYSFLYTLILKRRTSWNIVIGGIAGSFPALAGWSAVNTPISLVSIFVAVIVFLWTPTHFWTLALKYKDDYKSAKIPMLPAVKDERYTINAIIINTFILIAFSFLPLAINMGFPILYDILLAPVSLYFILKVVTLRSRIGSSLLSSSLRAFLASNYYLSAFLGILILGAVLRLL